MGKNDTASQFTTFSVFSTTDNINYRFQVIKEGYLDVAKPQKQETSKFSFCFYYCKLTMDGRLTLDHEASDKECFIIEECTVTDASIFRLLVTPEAELKSHQYRELVCKAKNEEEGTDWLIAVESALRKRLEQFKNELDCARGNLNIEEVLPGKPLKMVAGKPCQCFYYNNRFRVKGIDGPQTSQFQITNVKTDEINLPMCLILETPGRKFICKAEDVDQYKKWLYAIRKDITKAQSMQKDQTSGKENIMKAEMLIGPLPDRLIRVSAKYYPKDRLFETKDFAGVLDSFYIERCVKVPPHLKVAYNLIFHAYLMEQAGAENAAVKLYASCTNEDIQKWIAIFEPEMVRLSKLIERTIMQIELRRIMKNESGSDRRKRVVAFKDVYYLMELTDQQIEEQFVNAEDWPVGRLERLIQMIMKILPEPLIPYTLQKEFIETGKEIAASKVPKEVHYKHSFEKIEKLPDIQREIVEKMTLHIFRLTSYYSRKKLDPGSTGRETASTRGRRSSLSNHDLTVWSRLSKYIFRFNEQEMSDELCETNISYVSQVIVCFQKRFVELTRKQAAKSSSKQKRAEFEENCNQQ